MLNLKTNLFFQLIALIALPLRLIKNYTANFLIIIKSNLFTKKSLNISKISLFYSPRLAHHLVITTFPHPLQLTLCVFFLTNPPSLSIVMTLLWEYIKVYFKSEGWLSPLFILFDIIKLKIYKKIMFAWNYLNVIKKKAEREWKHVLMFRLKYQTLNNNSKMNIESNGKIANNKQYNNKILQFKMKSVKHFFWWWWNSFTPALFFVISPHPVFHY